MKCKLSVLVFGAVVAAATSQILASRWYCSVPVFRYALERWKPGNYEVVVFYRASSGTLDQKLIDDLTPEGLVGKSHTNLTLNLVDLDTESDVDLQKLWEQQQNPTLPWMVLRYPRPIDPAWSGLFNRQNVMLTMDSPMRQKIAKEILSGATAVWVFLESGDPKADEIAYKTLVDRLKYEEFSLKLPEISQEDIDNGLVSADARSLKISFPVVNLSRTNPKEKMLVEMLLGSEGTGKDSLRDPQYSKKPMAFPIFGRGRALYCLNGPGIMNDTIHEACTTLIAPCTCQIKDENPGMDLVIAMDWEKFIEPQFKDKPLPDLQGIGQFQKVPVEGESDHRKTIGRTGLDTSNDSKNMTSKGKALASLATPDSETVPIHPLLSITPANTDETVTVESNSLMRNTLVLFGACAIGVFGFTFFLISRRN